VELSKNFFLVIVGFASGMVISGGIFAFIAGIGVVPRLAYKTKTVSNIRLYEDAIILGGIFGCLDMYLDYNMSFLKMLAPFIALATGVFVGCLAVSLAEVLDVMPIFMRRARLKEGLAIFVFSLALGKMIGSLMFFFIPNFT